MIKYLGSKRKLIPHIFQYAGDSGTFVDLFSGTSRVGYAAKQKGFSVLGCDVNPYAEIIGRCYIEGRPGHLPYVTELISHLSALPPKEGWFTDTYCRKSRFFQPFNGARIDAIRDEIDSLKLSPIYKSIVLTALLEAADRVDSTTGVQMAYLKKWAIRSFNSLELRVPELIIGEGKFTKSDVFDLIPKIPQGSVVYVDPPYNGHRYDSNYHIWNSLTLWDKPEIYGIACKRISCQEEGSVFNGKRTFRQAYERLVQEIAKTRPGKVIFSFSNEGFLPKEDIISILSAYFRVTGIEIPYSRYVGAKIGIHSPTGEKVGSTSHTENVEYLFVCTLAEGQNA